MVFYIGVMIQILLWFFGVFDIILGIYIFMKVEKLRIEIKIY